LAQQLRLILFGPPGAGKGTQAQLLKDRLQVCHISSGELFRRRLQEQTPLGLKAAEFMNQGHLVPDEVTIDIILDMVLSIDSEAGFILDGFPRNPNQAEALESALDLRSRGLDRVVHIDVPESELVLRLGGRYCCRDCHAPHNVDLVQPHKGKTVAADGMVQKCPQCGGELYQRADDSPDAVRRRIEVYNSESLPVLGFYRERGLLVEVQGSGSVEYVNRRVIAALGATNRRPAG